MLQIIGIGLYHSRLRNLDVTLKQEVGNFVSFVTKHYRCYAGIHVKMQALITNIIIHFQVTNQDNATTTLE